MGFAGLCGGIIWLALGTMHTVLWEHHRLLRLQHRNLLDDPDMYKLCVNLGEDFRTSQHSKQAISVAGCRHAALERMGKSYLNTNTGPVLGNKSFPCNHG